ncbi:MAG: DUF1638 domain-containing protein [Verrucomicrobiota bacterium]|nr:DUF1638 domain-containing protein [Verrucomicrobiota bacterium]
MNLKLIACEVLKREFEYICKNSSNHIDTLFLPKGLHDLGTEKMLQNIQDALDNTDPGYDYIFMGYGLCNNGISGLISKTIPMVVPKAHDCITLFLGSRERYTQYFNDNPGVYFLTSGWLEYAEIADELKEGSIPHQLGMDASYNKLLEKYGKDNADYLYETLCNTSKNYSQYTFIEMGVEKNKKFEKQALEEAKKKDWRFEKIQGNLNLFKKPINGPWDNNFLIVNPNTQISPSYDEEVIRIKK